MTSFSPAPKPSVRPKRAKLPLPRVNPVRAAKRELRDYGPKGAFIRLQPCDCTGKRTGEWITDVELGRIRVQIVAAHFPSRGAGGRSQDLVPLAWHLEQRGHASKNGHKPLERLYRLNFRQRAAYWEKLWQSREARRAAELEATP